VENNESPSKYKVVIEKGENIAVGDSAQASAIQVSRPLRVIVALFAILVTIVCAAIAAKIAVRLLYTVMPPFTVQIDAPRPDFCRFALRDAGDNYAFVELPYCVHGRGEHYYRPEDAHIVTYVIGPIVHTGSQGEIYAVNLVIDEFEEAAPAVSPEFIYPECGGFGGPSGIVVNLYEISVSNNQREIPVLNAPYPLAQNESVSFRVQLNFSEPGIYTFHFEIFARESTGTRFRVVTEADSFSWKRIDAHVDDLPTFGGYGPEIQPCDQ